MPNKVRVNVVIHGRVQGVFFRQETQSAARRIGVLGWVRNKQDGTVEALFEGEKDRVEKLLSWCDKGSPLSKVERKDVVWEEYKGEFASFEVRYTF